MTAGGEEANARGPSYKVNIMVEGVKTKHQVYLLGNNFTVHTGHQALVSAFIPHMKSQVKGLLSRWNLKLVPFLPKIKLEFKPGSVLHLE